MIGRPKLRSDPNTGRRVYRRDEGRVVGSVFLLAGAAIFGELARVNLLFVIGVVALLWIAYRLFRIGVFADDDGVTVRDVLRTRKRVPWDEIDRFDLVRKRGYDAGGMYLKDGSLFTPIALQGPWGEGTAVPRALSGLNEELARHRRTCRPTSESTTAPVEATDQLTLPTS